MICSMIHWVIFLRQHLYAWTCRALKWIKCVDHTLTSKFTLAIIWYIHSVCHGYWKVTVMVMVDQFPSLCSMIIGPSVPKMRPFLNFKLKIYGNVLVNRQMHIVGRTYSLFSFFSFHINQNNPSYDIAVLKFDLEKFMTKVVDGMKDQA